MIVGLGGPTGRHLRELFESSGARIFNTYYRSGLPHDDRSTTWLPYNLLEPEHHLPGLLEAVSDTPLSSLVVFAHPTISRGTEVPPLDDLVVSARGLAGIGAIMNSFLPRLAPGGTVFFVVPDLSSIRAPGYLSARTYFGGLKGLVEEYSRIVRPPKATIVLATILHVPGDSHPHVSADTINRMGRQTLTGRLPDGKDLAVRIYDLLRSSNAWMHGKILQFQDGPLF